MFGLRSGQLLVFGVFFDETAISAAAHTVACAPPNNHKQGGCDWIDLSHLNQQLLNSAKRYKTY
jgi:hypothetical protein